MSDPWETRVEPARPKQGVSPGMIAVIATSVLVLSIAGATGGWLLAGSPDAGPSSSPSSSPTAGPSITASASPSPSPSVASPTPSTTGTSLLFRLPDPGTQTFQAYFAQLRELKLGVEVIFGQDGDAGRVTKTAPVVGSEVHAGITVKIYVAGPPAATELPYVVGRSCREAKNSLTPVGLKPVYKGALQFGVVIKQNPDPTQGGTANWNDRVELTCGTLAQLTASPSP